ncbi:hypothetical protein FLAG1_12115 [Fusarium langsethiae]|uniref:Nucleoside phosphorylase domain-containing protein n=1 Tax=Fusarium langsethiae TaxID=179993 RepID=A0A0M9ELK6_FUSLA|nr:hypothetical protein FLAG1_12115 [Fusarium langsethiae]GKU11121.1 unnamed protein product [Fusarium langsethiae]
MSQKRPLRPKSRDEFEIAIFCALPIEANAVLAVFDHHWKENEDGQSFGKAENDPNAYSNGVIGQHNVVLAHLPGPGKVAAATTAAYCSVSYPDIRLALVVGTCGGTPLYGKGKREILLGDVVISTGVVQHDFGRRFPDEFTLKETLQDSLGRPSLELRSLVGKLETKIYHEKVRIATHNHLQQMVKERKILAGHPGGLHDNLFPPNYRHKHQDRSRCTICAACNGNSDPVCDVALGSTCKELKCDLQPSLLRRRLDEVSIADGKKLVGSNSQTLFPMIHFGTFASGDMVVKSAEFRDQLATSTGAIGFEMESAGVWEIFQTVVIKGVSNYADCHNNDGWQSFAAASAAACTKAFLKYWDSTKQDTRPETEGQKRREASLNSPSFTEFNQRNNPTPPASITF